MLDFNFYDRLIEIALSAVQKFPVGSMILMALGSLVVLGQIVVAITPSKKDDEALSKLEAIPVLGNLIQVLKKFSVIQKK